MCDLGAKLKRCLTALCCLSCQGGVPEPLQDECPLRALVLMAQIWFSSVHFVSILTAIASPVLITAGRYSPVFLMCLLSIPDWWYWYGCFLFNMTYVLLQENLGGENQCCAHSLLWGGCCPVLVDSNLYNRPVSGHHSYLLHVYLSSTVTEIQTLISLYCGPDRHKNNGTSHSPSDFQCCGSFHMLKGQKLHQQQRVTGMRVWLNNRSLGQCSFYNYKQSYTWLDICFAF